MGDPRGFLKVRTAENGPNAPLKSESDWFDVHTESGQSWTT